MKEVVACGIRKDARAYGHVLLQHYEKTPQLDSKTAFKIRTEYLKSYD
jgi:hypothetical protein